MRGYEFFDSAAIALLIRATLLLAIFYYYHNGGDALKASTFWFVGLLVGIVSLVFEQQASTFAVVSFAIAFAGFSLLDRLDGTSYWIALPCLFLLLMFI